MTAAASIFLEAGDFAVGRCSVCGRDVLTYPDGSGPEESTVRRCLHCDQSIRGELRWVDVGDLEVLGYAVETDGQGGGCVSCSTSGCATKPSK